MKITAIFFSSSFATIALALPAAQYNDHWSGFFGPDPGYYQYGGGTPYYPSQLAPPGGANGQIPPPAVPPSMIEPISYGRPYENSGSSRLPPPPYPYSGNYEDPGPLRLPQPPQPPPIQYPQAPPPPGPLDGPTQRPAGPNQPSQPAAPLTPKLKLGKPVSEKPRDKKPLADRFTPELEDPLPAAPPPPRSPLPPQRAVVEDDVNSDDFDKDAIRYHVNVGGIQKGGGGGTTNFHVYSDENGNKRFSEELDEETEKYITENMIPKLGGKRKGGNRGGIWSVFGDN